MAARPYRVMVRRTPGAEPTRIFGPSSSLENCLNHLHIAVLVGAWGGEVLEGDTVVRCVTRSEIADRLRQSDWYNEERQEEVQRRAAAIRGKRWVEREILGEGA